MPDWVELEGLSLGRLILINLIWIAAVYVGVKAAEKWNNWTGWMVGICVFLLFGLLLWPAVEAIEQKACQIDPLIEDCN